MASLRAGWIVFASWVLCLPSVGAAAVIQVPADHPTIQAALDAAAPGDVVQVAPGTYVENVDFRGKALTVESTGGPEQTIIDGNATGSVVRMVSGEPRSAALKGFTIQNGSNHSGAGIRISSSSPTITGNRIVDNVGCTGVGVEVYFGSPLIEGNTIARNISQLGSGCRGGGIYVGGNGLAEIVGNDIRENSVDASGGGIQLNAAGRPIVRGNRIHGNDVWYGQGGGISAFNHSDAEIVQNEIAFNRAAHGGGGIQFLVPSGTRGPRLVNNTVAWNEGPSGAAILADGFAGTVEIVNNVLVSAWGPALSCESLYQNSPPLLRANDVWVAAGTSPGSGWCAGIESLNMNFSADPGFITATNADFRLSPSSPCVDAGEATAGLPATDLAGAARVADGNGDGSAVVDVGAYEHDGQTILGAAPRDLAFGVQRIGTWSTPRHVTLTNVGSTAILITGVLVDGAFSAVDDCAREDALAPGASCGVDVSFGPAGHGEHVGELQVFAGGMRVTAVGLSGTGVQPSLELDTTLAFGTIAVGFSSTKTTLLRNTGDGPLTLVGLFVNGADFTAESTTCGAILAGGASCAVDVRFAPTQRATRAGSLVVNTDATPTMTVALTGEGLAPLAQLTPSSVVFAQTKVGKSSSPTEIVIRNAGNAALVINAVQVTGEFSVRHTCTTPVAPGSTCAAAVSFVPSVRGVRTGTLSIVSNSLPAALVVPLSGEGVTGKGR